MFRRKRSDTKVASIEEQYGLDLGVRGDMKLGRLLQLTGCETVTDLRSLGSDGIRRRLARARPQPDPQITSYLEHLLVKYALRPQDEEAIRRARAQYEGLLLGGWEGGNPRIRYAGSVAKGTAIRVSYDLDMVLYFPAESAMSISECYEAVERRLRSARRRPKRRNVALRVQHPGFHVDIVPGKTLKSDSRYANLYVSGARTTRQTSIEQHVAHVREGGLRDVLQILKLWRVRHKVPIGSFAIELATAEALRGYQDPKLDRRVMRVLEFLRDDFQSARLLDPANSNNIISDLVSLHNKRRVAEIAARGCSEDFWKHVVW
ncbi:MAG: hypothetical protein WC683_16805 [bacterium]